MYHHDSPSLEFHLTYVKPESQWIYGYTKFHSSMISKLNFKKSIASKVSFLEHQIIIFYYKYHTHLFIHL